MNSSNPPPYSVKAVANTILTVAKEKQINDICLRKLQKIIYYANAWYLAHFDIPLIKERIEVWEFGPVIQEIFSEFSDFGLRIIDREAQELQFDIGHNELTLVSPYIPLEDERTIKLITKVVDEYGKLTAEQLLNLTHTAGDPWKVIINKLGDYNCNLQQRNLEIPNSLIKYCFNAKLHSIKSS